MTEYDVGEKSNANIFRKKSHQDKIRSEKRAREGGGRGLGSSDSKRGVVPRVDSLTKML
jgi:hypothetical protein